METLLDILATLAFSSFGAGGPRRARSPLVLVTLGLMPLGLALVELALVGFPGAAWAVVLVVAAAAAVAGVGAIQFERDGWTAVALALGSAALTFAWWFMLGGAWLLWTTFWAALG